MSSLPTLEPSIRAFREAAIAKGDFVMPAARDHSLHATMKLAVRAFDAAGPPGLDAPRQLARDASPHVRGWAAAELLSRGDESMVSVFEELASHSGLMARQAETVLREYRAGRLASPFGAPAS